MARLPSWYLNGISLATLGFTPEPTAPSRRSGLSLIRQSVELPGVAGEIASGFGPRASARTITVAGNVRGADRATTLEAIRTILSHANRGLVSLRCVDALDREILVERTDAAIAGLEAPSMLAEQRDGRVELRFWAAEPAWRDLAPQVLVIGHDATPCPLGGLPSPWTLEITSTRDGGANSVTVHYEDAASNLVASLELDGVVGIDRIYRITTEGEVPRVRYFGASGWVDAEADVVAGNFFLLSPHDGAPALGLYPTVRLEDPDGGYTSAVLTYTRRHEL